MRALIDIAEPDIRALDMLGRARHQSRAALVREAVAGFLAHHGQGHVTDAFGLWGQRQDGLEYQEQVRAEW